MMKPEDFALRHCPYWRTREDVDSAIQRVIIRAQVLVMRAKHCEDQERLEALTRETERLLAVQELLVGARALLQKLDGIHD